MKRTLKKDRIAAFITANAALAGAWGGDAAEDVRERETQCSRDWFGADCGVPTKRGRGGLWLVAWVLCVIGSLELAGVAVAAEPDSFDLESVSFQPTYVSPAQIRRASCLRAVAFSPLDSHRTPEVASVAYNQPRQASGSIGIAVGDAGTILRSDDDGESWWPIEYVSVVSEDSNSENPRSSGMAGGLFSTGMRSGPTRRERVVPIPFCEFSDVLWLSARDVVVVGGGYEPVTGISRGVCVVSHDAGESWMLADAHELPRLRAVALGGRGAIEAVGDASEASGVNRFGSYDGGESWVEDILPSSEKATRNRVDAPRVVATSSGQVTVEDLCQAPTGFEFAVASHGRVFRRVKGETTWRSLRGEQRRTGVLFVASSAATVPWSIVGRETLQEQRRTAIYLDEDATHRSANRKNDSGKQKLLDRCRAAAAMLGVSEVHGSWSDGSSADLIGSTLAERGVADETERKSEWLREHRPSVVVLDESLGVRTIQSWLTVIERIRTRAFTEQSHATEQWLGPQRIVLTRPLDAEGHAIDCGCESPRPWERAWKHASVLRGNALLTGVGALANDLSVDALMMAAPGHVSPDAIEIATLDDSSGSVRRDVSLAAGVGLTTGQNRQEGQEQTASHRQLQITTARMNQTVRLKEKLHAGAKREQPRQDRNQLKMQVEQVLALTAPDDRTRLLWEGLIGCGQVNGDANLARDVLLELLAQNARPASIRRWAELRCSAMSTSVEANMVRAFAIKRPSASNDSASELSAGEVPGDAPESHADAGAGVQPLSPFQVAPVAYLSGMESHGRPAPQILVPETQRTVWQSTGRMNGFASPLSSLADQKGQTSKSDDNSIAARVNWDYHPVVMAVRGVVPMVSKRLSDRQRGRDGDSLDRDGLGRDEMPVAAEPAKRAVSRYSPPHARQRPLLDARDDDACWSIADVWDREQVTAKCAADEDYLYVALYSDRPRHFRLLLDCDGDYVTSLQFDLAPDGTRRACVHGGAEVNPVWYAAVGSGDAGLASKASNNGASRNILGNAVPGSVEASLGDQSRPPIRMFAEIAIARSSLPAAVCRIHAGVVAHDADPNWIVMPNPSEWYPSRQLTSGRQY
ncbi:DOMON domain-containing protein [Rhodopirellula sallentina]|uniref:Putative membrane or secreted protein n=1 Tax=Rhodopirellula sallentina SM41 TaxID=1263870 RepID=M5UJR0_9BACT|nr:membrane or protein [Rhodopirellula sallentina]EMI58091.1 putative membrane or secreted protein [Rhodopirellula sallentina SM41]